MLYSKLRYQYVHLLNFCSNGKPEEIITSALCGICVFYVLRARHENTVHEEGVLV